MRIVHLILILMVAMLGSPALWAQAKPAIIYGLGSKFDKSFNEAAYNGAMRFADETDTVVREFELQSDAQREQAMRRFVRQGSDPIIVTGFTWEQSLRVVAAEAPDTNFVIIDAVVDLPNVQSVVFKEQEGSYLVGLLAALASESDKIGFVGGMDIPLIRAFACGYRQGAKSANPDIEILENMTGTTGAAWNDPVKGGELTKSQVGRGADVIYHAAGATGIGVLQAAADAGVLGIGVDSNQNHLHPGSVLTSMLKRVDVAVYNAMMDVENGTFSPGLNILGLAEDGVGIAVDENNRDLISEEMQIVVNKAMADIVSGDIVVHDYRSDDSCPVE